MQRRRPRAIPSSPLPDDVGPDRVIVSQLASPRVAPASSIARVPACPPVFSPPAPATLTILLSLLFPDKFPCDEFAAATAASDESPRGESILDTFTCDDEIPPDDYLSPKQIGCLTALLLRQCDIYQ